MKSIRMRILVPTLVTMIVALVSIAGYSAYSNYSSTMGTLEQTMTETVKVAANQTKESLGKMTAVVHEFADTARLKDSGLPSTEKQAILDEKLALGYFESIQMTDARGISLQGADRSDREYVQNCITSKKPFVSDPFFSEELNKMTLVVSAPSMEGSRVVGVVYAVVDANFLSSITNTIKVGESGTAYMVNNKGVTIAYNDPSLVLDQYNTQEEAKTDKALAALGALEGRMVAGETGFGTYSYGGEGKLMSFAPVPDSNGWAIAITAGQSEFMQSTFNSIIISLIVLAVFLLLAAIILFKVANSIANPIKMCASRLEKLSKGDLKTEVPQIKAKDETGVLANATESIVTTLDTIISDEDYMLGAMADGNFDISSRAQDKYVGDFNHILLAVRNINRNLSRTLSEIDIAADQVSSGSEQVSSGAQALSQGATEQASSVEELSATITEISEKVKTNASDAVEASRQVDGVGNELEASNRQMQEMIGAMTEISNSSNQIGKIIKTIEDIAFQTNILALNAAVEAARAGAAGKGFAVVAEEVRSLAGKSQEAAKNTTSLIQGSIEAVERGTKLADGTAKSLLQVVDGAKSAVTTVDKISAASSEQASSIAQVTQGIEQISAVVQTNSATAEESAAASEELNSQAAMLKSLVGKFKLNSENSQGEELRSRPGAPAAQFENKFSEATKY